jgi:hypothetical protein
MGDRRVGTVYSYHQLMMLLAGLSHERKSEQMSAAAAAEVYKIKGFRRAYRDMLTSLVLFDHAKVSVPPYLAEGIEAEFLIREGLLELSDLDYVGPVKSRISKLYDRCYRYSRSLEVNPLTSRLVSLDTPLDSPRLGHRLDAETDLGELYHNYRELVGPRRPFGRRFARYLRVSLGCEYRRLLIHVSISQRFLHRQRRLFRGCRELR